MHFQRDLIKGRIAETIFEEMFRATEGYAVFRFGYEMTHAMIAQYQHLAKNPAVLDQVRDNPDFLLITNDKKEYYFIEIKYRRHIDQDDIYNIAKALEERWGISHVFVVSHDGFYYGNVHDLVRRKGDIQRLPAHLVAKDIQDRYLRLLHEFLP